MNKLKVTGLAVYEAKGMPGIPKNELELVEDSGIRGDMYAKGGDRQLTIADTRIEASPKELVIGELCGKKFKANILADNILEAGINAGDIFRAGDAVIEITAAQKECFPDACDIAAEGRVCALKSGSLFAKVIKSGNIHIGDYIERD